MERKAILVAGLVLLMGTGNTWAWDKEADGKGGPGKMSGIMDLTEDQKAKLKAIGEAQRAEAQPLHLQAKERIKELRTLKESKAGDAAITAKLEEIKKLRTTMQEVVKKYMDQREQVLTPAQRAEMALRKSERMGDGKGGKTGMRDKKGGKCAAEETPKEPK